MKTNLSNFLKPHDFTYEKTPDAWIDGVPLGNGHIGAMIWGNGNPLKITLDKTDLWEIREPLHDEKYKYSHIRELVEKKRFDEVEDIVFTLPEDDCGNIPHPTKLPLPRLEIKGMQWGKGRLRLCDAVFETADWSCFVHARKNLLVINSVNTQNISVTADYPSEAVFAEQTSFGEKDIKTILKQWGYPELEYGTSDNVEWVRQNFPFGGCYVVGWILQNGMFLLSVSSSRETDDPLKAVIDILESNSQYNNLYSEHSKWWMKFWEKSSISIPDSQMESLYYAELYKFACCVRPDGYPVSLQGVWTKDGCMPPWDGDYHLDMNIQEDYWLIYTSNHLDMGFSLYDKFSEWLPRFQKNCKEFFECEGAWARCSIGIDGTEIANNKQIGYSALMCCQSHLAWVAHHYWLHYKYSMDKTFLKEKAVPFMKSCWQLYDHVLEKGEDGKLHLPICQSPEYNEMTPDAWQKDASHDRALIQFLCESLIEADDILGNIDPQYNQYKEMLNNLYDYPGNDEFWVAEDQPYDQSHRHCCHMMALHPLGLFTPEKNTAEWDKFAKSMKTLIRMGPANWFGHTYPQISLLASRMGYSEMAWMMLRHYFCFIGANTLHRNVSLKNYGITLESGQTGAMTVESGFAFAAGVLEMLIQSWDGMINIFPAIPEFWANVSFSDLLAEGGIKVSAEKRSGKLLYVELESPRDCEIKLRNGFDNNSFNITGGDVIENGKIIRILSKANNKIRLEAKPETLNMIALSTDSNLFGLKKIPGF
jgi:alpha-L-fucosidase 2